MPFWVGGSGNWSDAAAHWAAASGGAPGAANLPTALLDAIFDANSNASNAAYAVTLNVAAFCRDFLVLAKPGDGLGGTVSIVHTNPLTVNGNFETLAGMSRTGAGSVQFQSPSGVKTIRSNGVTHPGNVGFVGGPLSLLDDLNGAAQFSINAGSLETNGKTVSCTAFSAFGGTLTLGASVLNVVGNFIMAPAVIFSGALSTINLSGGVFQGGGKTYGTVNMTVSFANRTWGQDALPNVAATVTVTCAPQKTNSIQFGANLTVTGTLTIAGNSPVNRLFVSTSAAGVPRTITAAAVVLSNVDFMDIQAAGAAAPFAGVSLGDCLGNSGFTFTPAQTQHASGAVSFSWSTHPWTSRVPLPQDDVVIANAFIAGRVITADMPRLGKNISFAGVTGNPGFTLAPGGQAFFGSLEMNPAMTFPGWPSFLRWRGRSPCTLKSAGAIWPANFTFEGPGGTLTLLDEFRSNDVGGNVLAILAGTFDSNNFPVTYTQRLTINGGTLVMRASEFVSTVVPPGGVWWLFTSGAIQPGTSKIRTTAAAADKTFSGGGQTYYDLELNAGVQRFTGANTFRQFKAAPAADLRFTAGTVTTAADWQLGAGCFIGSITAANHTLAKAGGGFVIAAQANVSRSNATPANAFYAYPAGVDAGNNVGWTFAAPFLKPFVADPIVGALTAPDAVVGVVLAPAALVGALREPQRITGAL